MSSGGTVDPGDSGPGSEPKVGAGTFSNILSGIARIDFAHVGEHRSRKAAYAQSVLIVALITGVGLLINLRVAPTNVAMLYLLGVGLNAFRWGFGPAIVSATISTFVFDYLFIPPYFSFAITDVWYLITLIAMLSIGILISVLASTAREQTLIARERAAEAEVLGMLTLSVSNARNTEQVLHAAGDHIRKAFGRAVAILLTGADQNLIVGYKMPGLELDAGTRAKADRIYRQALSHSGISDSMFLPLRAGARVIGIMVLPPAESQASISGKPERVLEAVAGQVALAIERATLERQAREAEVLRKANELHRTLLNSVSHGLRAPLAAVLTALDPITDAGAATDHAAAMELARIAQSEVHRLDRLVSNLLDLSRLEAGVLSLKKEAHDIQDIVGSSLGALRRFQERRIDAVVEPDIPLVPVDFVLIERILVNLLDNAVKYSPANQPVHLAVRRIGGYVEIRVSDRGYGIPPAERERIFQRFARGAGAEREPGVGLGLAVAKGFVEAHEGRIWVEERPGGGSIFCFTMPLESG